MNPVKKIVLSLFASVFLLAVVTPPLEAEAETIKDFYIFKIPEKTSGARTPVKELIAGVEYSFGVNIDVPSATNYYYHFHYSQDGEKSWIEVQPNLSHDFKWIVRLPMNPQMNKVYFRLYVYVQPLQGGSTSYTSKVFGPFKVYQPGPPTSFVAKANDNGTVTLSWMDNSSMESWYKITRSGSDGVKVFYRKNSMEYIGELTYVDETTAYNTSYEYKLTAEITEFELPKDWKNVVLTTKVTTKPFFLKNQQFEIVGPITTLPTIPVKPPEKLPVIDKIDVPIFPFPGPLPIDPAKPGTPTPVPAPPPAPKPTPDPTPTAEPTTPDLVTGPEPGSDTQPQASQTEIKLTDIQGHWAAVQIMEAVQQGFVQGYPDSTFKPERTVTRAEFAVMLMRAMQVEGAGAELTFGDKQSIGAWALKQIAQCVQLGIIKGYPDGSFQPNKTITHAEMITMVMRASNLPITGAKTGYVDDADIPSFARGSSAAAELYSILNYITDKRFKPQELTTRAEALTSILNMIKVNTPPQE